MQNRRLYRRSNFRSSMGRPKPHYQWARDQVLTVGTFTEARFDLLRGWRVANNLTINLPDIVIWRIHLKISLHFTLSPAALRADNGVFIGIFCDSNLAAAGIISDSQPYDEQYLVWDKIYYDDLLANGGSNFATTNPQLYKEYDVRSHRKLLNQADSLIMDVIPRGNVTFGATDAVAYTSSVLLKLPGRG